MVAIEAEAGSFSEKNKALSIRLPRGLVRMVGPLFLGALAAMSFVPLGEGMVRVWWGHEPEDDNSHCVTLGATSRRDEWTQMEIELYDQTGKERLMQMNLNVPPWYDGRIRALCDPSEKRGSLIITGQALEEAETETISLTPLRGVRWGIQKEKR